jgi:hypothetical protein
MGALASPLLVVFVGVLHHDDRGVDQHADRDGDAAERHDVGPESLELHDHEGQENRYGDRDDGHEGGPDVEKKHQTNQRHHDRFFDKGVDQRLDRPLDETGAVIGDRDLHILGQTDLELCEALLDLGDGGERIGAPADHDHTADCLAFAIPIGEAAADLGTDSDVGDIFEQDRYAPGATTQDSVLQIPDLLDVTPPPHHELALRHLDQPAADFDVRTLDRLLDSLQRQPVGAESNRIDLDLVLADEATDRRDFGDAFD